MNTADERGGLGSILGAATELLKNPAVIEGVLAGVSALAASRRVKNPSGAASGFDIGGMLDLLPQVMPLLSLFTQSGADISSAEDSSSLSVSENEAVTVSADGSDMSEVEKTEDYTEDAAPAANISYGGKKERRENLLLAIRPYLSESRVAAADAMIQVNRISGLFGS